VKWQKESDESVVKIRFDGMKKVTTQNPRIRQLPDTNNVDVRNERRVTDEVEVIPAKSGLVIPGKFYGFEVQKSDVNDILEIHPPHDLYFDMMALGSFKSILAGSPYAVGLTPPTFKSLCEYGNEWTNDILNTFSAVCHKLYSSNKETTVIPFGLDSGFEDSMKRFKDYVFTLTSKIYMFILDQYRNENDEDQNHCGNGERDKNINIERLLWERCGES